MPAQLDHLIVPARNRVASAKRLAGLLGVQWTEQGPVGPFSPVYVNDGLTLDFDQWDGALPKQHYCFRVGDDEFETILSRIEAEGIAYRSLPHGEDDYRINPAFGGKIVYWGEPDGHVWELLTVSYERQTACQDHSLEHARGARAKRIGFLEGRISVPDDFDRMGQAEIELLFGR